MTHDLPAGWSVRHPTLDDVPEILTVIHASDIAAVGEPDYTADEVREALTGPHHDPARDSWVALDERGRIASWAFIENTTAGERDLLDVYVHPEYGQPAQPVLLDLAVARVAERAAEFGHPGMTARAGAIATEKAWIAVLEAAGFAFVKRYARMKRTLTADVPAGELPPGVTIRVFDHESAEERRVFHRILEDSFKDLPDYLPFDHDTYWARIAALPSTSWDEWFIAFVDGQPAGILQSSDQSVDNDEGWIKNLAVAREFRGRGAGAALLRTAFARYAAKGRTLAGLGVDMTNPTGAYRLYSSVGMHPAYEADVYERQVDAVRVGRDRSSST